MAGFQYSLQDNKPSALFSLPIELRIIIYENLVQNEKEYINLRWIPARLKSRNRLYQGIFGLLLTSRLVHLEVKPIVQAYIGRHAHKISIRQLEKYVTSNIPRGQSSRKLRIVVDRSSRGVAVDILPLIQMKRQHRDYIIDFDIRMYHECEVLRSLLALLDRLGASSSPASIVCSSVQITWRDWSVPFVILTPAWYNSQDVQYLQEYVDRSLPQYLGVDHLWSWLEFRTAYSIA